MSRATYLGDAVYVSLDAGVLGIMLTTDHHEAEQASNVIYLDDSVLKNLKLWLIKEGL